MRHAVILFSGREGSSAIVSHLRRHPRIAVPLFEDLDDYNVQEQVAPERRQHLTAALRRIFRSGRYKPGFFAEGSGEDVPLGEQRTAFKWRAWRLDPPVAEVFAAEDAGVFLLNRRDLLNQNLSLYLTREVIGGGTLVHPQFLYMEMAPEERPGYVEQLRTRRFRVDHGPVERDMREQIDAKRAVLGAMRHFAAAGVPVHPIWYEDFAADARAFLEAVLQRMGLELRPAVLQTEYVKMSREDVRDQVENLEELEARPAIRGLLREWRRTCAEIEALGAPGGGGAI